MTCLHSCNESDLTSSYQLFTQMPRCSIKTSLVSLKQLKQIGSGFQSDLLLKNLKTPNSSVIAGCVSIVSMK